MNSRSRKRITWFCEGSKVVVLKRSVSMSGFIVKCCVFLGWIYSVRDAYYSHFTCVYLSVWI